MFFFEALSQFAEKAQLSRMNLSEVPSENTQPWIVFRLYNVTILQLHGQNFAIFNPSPLRGQFLYPERGQKQTFLTPLPPFR